jgi:putative DNA primase/helicase
LLEEFKALPVFHADRAEGQDKRAAARFALIALAGELATEYGLTGWPEGAAIEAAATGLELWRSLRGTGNDERRQIPEQVAAFIERHGDSRFSCSDSGSSDRVYDRAGWWRATEEGREYLFNADGMHEALRGFDFRHGLYVLQEVGALAPPKADGKRAQPFRIAGRSVRLYPINPDKLGDSHV